MRYPIIPLLLATLSLSACSSGPKKQIVDESDHKPSWVSENRETWEDGGKVLIKAQQQVRGNERLSACYDLAKLNSKETLVSEIQQQVKGTLDNAELSTSEDAEKVLGKSRSAEFAGKISGLRFAENYFVRYRIGETERIDCFVLGEITSADYAHLKHAILTKVEEADPRIKEAIAQKHIDFFKKPERAPTAVDGAR